jgi:hypothetical protein
MRLLVKFMVLIFRSTRFGLVALLVIQIAWCSSSFSKDYDFNVNVQRDSSALASASGKSRGKQLIPISKQPLAR